MTANMKTSELRLGNLVLNSWGENSVEVTIDILMSLEFMGSDSKYKPIPLTEEWLLNFGFVKGDYNWFRLYFEPDNVDYSDCFTYNISSKMLCLESFYSGEKTGSIQLLALREKYVHQLQNLYFALTGEEITFKSE